MLTKAIAKKSIGVTKFTKYVLEYFFMHQKLQIFGKKC